MKQGDIYLVNLNPTQDSEQSELRPVVIISGNTMNDNFSVVITCPISSVVKNFSQCLVIKKNKQNGLDKDS